MNNYPPQLFNPVQVYKNHIHRKNKSLDDLHKFLHTLLKERISLIARNFKKKIILSYFEDTPFGRPSNTGEQIISFSSGEENSADQVLSYFHAHWLNDLPGFFAQCHYILKPDGWLMGVMAGEDSLFELKDAFMQAELETHHNHSMRFSPLARVKDIGALLQRASFALPVVDKEEFTLQYAHLQEALHELRACGQGRAFTFATPPLTRQILKKANEIFIQKHKGKVTVQFILLSGWKKDSSLQQQPLRPGSAQFSLEKALKNT